MCELALKAVTNRRHRTSNFTLSLLLPFLYLFSQRKAYRLLVHGIAQCVVLKCTKSCAHSATASGAAHHAQTAVHIRLLPVVRPIMHKLSKLLPFIQSAGLSTFT
jgi:hypothetical protein